MRAIVLAAALLASVVCRATADSEAGHAAFAAGDYAAAFPPLLDAAEQGDVAAQSKVAVMYRDGLGVPADPGLAFPWFRKAAEGGDAEAQYSLAGYYLLTNRPTVARWYRKAAAQGHAEAQLSLGRMSLQGDSIPVDVDEGLRLVMAAAAQGLAAAKFELGQVYLLGRYVDADQTRALMWFMLTPEDYRPEVRLLREKASEGLTESDIAQAADRADAWRRDHQP